MSVKALRHYHRIGLLEPAAVDPSTGYRRYTTEQIPTAQVIRRFRALDMPLTEVQAVLAAPDIHVRNDLIAAHLSRLEEGLSRTQAAVASLRDLLDRRSPAIPVDIRHRTVAATPSAAIAEIIDTTDATSWLQGALGELYGTLAAQGIAASGSPGGVFADGLFSQERGLATIFIPCSGQVRPMGRVHQQVVPAIELATIVHSGSLGEIDRSYGSLATYVTQHELAVAGPLREYYLVDRADTDDESLWRTEIGWPIFHTADVSAED